MKRLSLILFIFIMHINCFGQRYLQGSITDENKSPLPFVNVILRNPADSSHVIYGTVTDLKGRFSFKNIKSKNYLVLATMIGYDSDRIPINLTDSSIDDLDLILKHFSETLGEVTIMGNNTTQYSDRITYNITPLNRKVAASSFDLIESIPKLNINPVEKTIQTIHNESVKILINGQGAESFDLISLKPETVIRIDHYDIPPARFASSGVGAVINIITKKNISGVELVTDLQNAPFTGFGNDLLKVTYNRKNSQFGILYYLSYRDYKDRTVDDYLNYQFKNNNYMKERKGGHDPFSYQSHYLRLEYITKKTDNYTIGARFSPGGLFTSKRNYSQEVYSNQQKTGNAKIIDSFDELKSVFNLYLNKQFKNNQELLVDITGTYFDNDYTDERYEFDLSGERIFDNYLKTGGNKYSIIAEAIYSKSLEKLKLSSGIQYSRAYSDQKITNTLGNSSASSHVSSSYGFVEASGKITKISYTASLGLSHHQYEDKRQQTQFDFFSFRPLLSITYLFDEKFSFKLNYSGKPVIPTLSQLSPSQYYFDEDLVFSGNPNLKPYVLHKIKTNLSYGNSTIKVGLESDYSFTNSPLLFNYRKMDDYIIKITNNHKNQRRYSSSMNIDILPFPKKWLKLSLYGELYKTSNEFSDNTKTDIEGNYYKMSLSAHNKKGWTFRYSYISNYKTLNSLDIQTTASYSSVSLQYKKGNFTTKLGMLYPFSDSWKSRTKTVTNSIIDRRSEVNIYDNGQMAFINISYNISLGRKRKLNGKKIYNKDNDSGVLRTE